MSIARHVVRAAGFAACLLLGATVAPLARAQGSESGPTKAERAAARDAYDKGTTSFQKGDYAKALDSFVKANALIPSVQALYWIAQAQDKLGRTEAAIEAYEAITARADFSKLSEDKASVVRERLAALKPTPPAAPAPTPEAPLEAEPPAPPVTADAGPPATSAPAFVTSPPALLDDDAEPRPARNTAELGVMGGALFVSDSNNLVQGGYQQRPFESPVWELGVRAAFFPARAFGVEAEWAHGFGATESSFDTPSKSAAFNALRGHVIGQLPWSRFVPFALLGAGILHETSKPTGSDSDFALQAGVGAKVFATKLIVPRVDFRLSATQKRGGGFGDGITLHPEVLVGLSFVLGR